MDLTARCLFLLSCLGVILAIDLEATDPGYYVDHTATSETIDYKDPCKAGEVFFPFFLYYGVILYGGRNMPRICCEGSCGDRSNKTLREMTVPACSFKGSSQHLCGFV